jgi:two-component system chemotaxis sensor kinase CheA
MNNQERLSQLVASLEREIGSAQAGSSQGQFPILDLLGNLRDEAAGKPEWSEQHKLCADAWERMVKIVESGQSFVVEDVRWLQDLFPRIRTMIGGEGVPAATPAEAANAPTTTVPAPAAKAAAAGAQEEMPLNLDVTEDGDLLREFITESREHLDNIEQGVLVLENQPADAETLNTIFRAFHTFKGGAGFLNLAPINRLAHVLESLLDLARQGKLKINTPVIELILGGHDVLKKFLDEIEGQVKGTCPVATILIPTARFKAEVQRVIDGVQAGTYKPEAVVGSEASPSAPVQPAIEAPATAAPVVSPAAPAATAPAAEPSASAAEAEKKVHDVKGGGSNGGDMVKVETAKLDGLLDLVGEMVIAQSLVSGNLSRLSGQDPQLVRNMAHLSRITKELQRVSMSLRMVPIRGMFQKMARVTRDLGAKLHKKVQFATSGEDTELDRGVVEELSDPLLHMIRNSMDHGIESGEQRIAAGKPAMGTVWLRAYHQGGSIVIEIEDDGAGLNRERILKKAIERGLTTAGADHTDEEVFGFVFEAGFSTADKVTDLSGRGVGLDVVRRNIEQLRGRVDISSRPGRGTLFKIILPLTLAIIDGLIVQIGEERYVIPTLSVRESFRPKADMISQVQGRAEVVNVRGRLIPLLRLNELFGTRPKSTDAAEGIIVVVQSGTSLRCLWVDGLLHKQEVVIKNLNDMLIHKNRALAGAAILGDGRVGLILDIDALVHLEHQLFSQAA